MVGVLLFDPGRMEDSYKLKRDGGAQQGHRLNRSAAGSGT
jgi:hypothetical protein